MTLVAPPQALAPGVALLEFAAAVPGARPASAAVCRARGCPARSLRLRVDLAAVQAWARRLVGARLPGWRVGHVAWDMLDGTGDLWRWTLRGRDDAGAEVWLRIDLAARVRDGRLGIVARRCGSLGAGDVWATWQALARRLVGPGVKLVEEGWLEIDGLRAALGARFAAAGWRLPGGRGLAVSEVEIVGGALVWTLRAGAEARVSWPEGQVGRDARVESWPEGQVGRDARVESLPEGQVGRDAGVESWPEGRGRGALRGSAGGAVGRASWPKGQVRRSWLLGQAPRPAWLAGPVRAAGVASADLHAEPALRGPLARARARALRFSDRAGCLAAARAWLSAAPEDAEAWWLLVVLGRGAAGELDAALAGLAALPGAPAVQLRRRLAQALALQRRTAGAGPARALLEPLLAGLADGPPALQAAVWRALARARAGDAAVPGPAVEAAVAAALGEEGWRRRGEAGELRAQVAATLLGSKRTAADTTRLLRRLLGDERPARPAGRGRRGERDDARTGTRIVADYYAQEGRWPELVNLLEREVLHLEGAARVAALRQVARVHLHHLRDPARAEQALRAALVDATGEDRERMHAELLTCRELRGRDGATTDEGP